MNTTRGGSTGNKNIKNIINEDDLIPKILNKKEGYGRVGTLYNDSIYDNLQSEYKTYGGDIRNYKISPKKVNTIIKVIEKTKNDILEDMWKNKWVVAFSKYLNNYVKIANDKLKTIYSNYSVKLKTILNENVEGIKKAHEMKSYYTLAKTLNGFDLNNNDVSWTQCEEEVISEIDVPDDEYEHIYIEIDWQSGYPPDKAQLEIVAKSFEEHNIKLYIDAGEYSVNYEGESESNVLKGLNYEKILRLGDDIDTIKSLVKNNFSDRKNFRYCMYIKEIRPSLEEDKNPNEYTLGIADDIPGKMFILSKEPIELRRSKFYSNQEAATFTHELGHTLGLCHGGDEHIIYKPNHVSIMNYAYTNHYGLEAENEINYSEYEFPEMDFNHIDETKGIDPKEIGKKIKGIWWRLKDRDSYCDYYQSYKNDKSIDFNYNGKIEKDVKVDFYLKYGTIWEIVKSFIIPDKCKKSINEWDVVYKRIKPKSKVNYKWFKQDNNEEVN